MAELQAGIKWMHLEAAGEARTLLHADTSGRAGSGVGLKRLPSQKTAQIDPQPKTAEPEHSFLARESQEKNKPTVSDHGQCFRSRAWCVFIQSLGTSPLLFHTITFP